MTTTHQPELCLPRERITDPGLSGQTNAATEDLARFRDAGRGRRVDLLFGGFSDAHAHR